jgi:hypothetical protein
VSALPRAGDGREVTSGHLVRLLALCATTGVRTLVNWAASGTFERVARERRLINQMTGS